MTRAAIAVLATSLLTISTGPLHAQTPPVEAAKPKPTKPTPAPAPAPAPATPAPAPAQPPATTPAAPARPRSSTSSSAATLTMTVKVTDSTGAPLVGTKVTASGPVTRSTVSDATGTVRFLAMRAGAYRLRFESPTTITLERDITLRSGAGAEPIEASLSPAPPPPPPPPAPEPTRTDPIAGRGGLTAPSPRTVAIPEFVERNMLASREPAKTTMVACGPTSTTNMIQIRDPLKAQTNQDAEALLYVVGGEGLLGLPTADVQLVAGTFSLIPRGMTYTLQRKGRSALILLVTLTDTACPK